MNFNELDADWLLERSACLQVTKSWEMTLSCHSKNVLYPFSRNLDSSLPKILFTGVHLNLQVMLLMPIRPLYEFAKCWGEFV